MLLSALSVLVVAQSSSEIPEGLMNNPVYNKNSDAWGNVFSLRIVLVGPKTVIKHSYILCAYLENSSAVVFGSAVVYFLM